MMGWHRRAAVTTFPNPSIESRLAQVSIIQHLLKRGFVVLEQLAPFLPTN